MAEIINLNDTTPAPPPGDQNVKWLKDPTPSGTDPQTGLPIYSVSASVQQPLRVVSAVPGRPSGGQEVVIFPVPFPISFPANFASSVGGFGKNGANPTSTALYTVYKNTTEIGTVSIATDGAFTFATTGGTAQTATTNDVVSILAPPTQDTTLSSVAIVLYANRTG